MWKSGETGISSSPQEATGAIPAASFFLLAAILLLPVR
jgi:hypothetical protein